MSATHLPPPGAWHLFVDAHAIDHMTDLRLVARTPDRRGVALQTRHPWDGAFSIAIATLPRPGGGFRLYYRALHEHGDYHLAVAESDDGKTWHRPMSDRHPLPGHPRTNIIATLPGNVDVWWDDGPHCPADERVKAMTYAAGDHALTPVQDLDGMHKHARVEVSGNGLDFRPADWGAGLSSDLPNVFDGQNRIAWCQVEGRYIAWCRVMAPERTLARTTSANLREWSPLTVVEREQDPKDELYRSGLQPCPGAPHHWVGVGLRFHPGRGTVDPPSAARLASWGPHHYDRDTSDIVLLTARPGHARLDRAVRQSWIRPGPDPRNWSSRTNAPAAGLFRTGPRELSFLVHRGYAREHWWIERFSIPDRRFASLHADWQPGYATTVVLGPAAGQLDLDLATGAGGYARIGLRGARGGAIRGYGLDDCDPVFGDRTARVTWGGRSLPSHLRGRPLRLEIALQDADLYALRWTG